MMASSHAAEQQQHFGAALTEPEVVRMQTLLRDRCGVEVPLPEAWSRAIELIDLVELLLAAATPRPGLPE